MPVVRSPITNSDGSSNDKKWGHSKSLHALDIKLHNRSW